MERQAVTKVHSHTARNSRPQRPATGTIRAFDFKFATFGW
jgi:hypothetical protein